ncbi:GDSL-type esterase/lipase family protein [Foetidibacter luteolus]|uniref:GDSL-type esterase/lipase family protein n=1 Tax=Foetidibacter luteolus TaxID=2608880 RepID=UPI00129AE8B2|nr:GDSL-type esterase/lipase family protein [Foetidibacter luteolus]
MVWYEDEIKRIEQQKSKLTYEPQMVFYGSSSIRLWDKLNDDFAAFKPVNLGFGGSTLAACVWFFKRVLKPYHPKHIVIYAGDNDLGDGRNPEEVFIFFQQLMWHINHYYHDVPLTYISIKPSIARWNINEKIRYTNTLIKKAIDNSKPHYRFINIYDAMTDSKGYPLKDLYDADGLHLSPKGYWLWKQILLTNFSSEHENFLT